MPYGIINHMKARKLFYRKILDEDGPITEMVIWKLPEKDAERPHGLKYRLYYGNAKGECLVRYDNEKGKGDHKHLGGREYSYEFMSVEKLVEDFLEDIKATKNRGKK